MRFDGPCSAIAGTTVEYRLYAADTALIDAAAYQGTLLFDPAVLELQTFIAPSEGRFTAGPSTTLEQGAGVVEISGLACGASTPLRGREPLARMRFKVIGPPGSSTLIRVGAPTLLDPAGRFVPAESVGFRFKTVSSPDRDCDGFPDSNDNCPTIYNPDQADGNHTGVGDVCEGLSVTLASFTAEVKGKKVLLRWETATELNTAGFNILRSSGPEGPWERVNAALIPAQGSPTSGGVYELVDRPGRRSGRVWYAVQDVDLSGAESLHRPLEVVLRKKAAGGSKP